jgi:hypothetical protein
MYVAQHRHPAAMILTREQCDGSAVVSVVAILWAMMKACLVQPEERI